MSDQKPFLNVPEPAHRPDTAPDFNDFDVPRPGAVGRPPLDIAPEAARGLAYEIIRVTHDDGAAIGEWARDEANVIAPTIKAPAPAPNARPPQAG